MICHECSKPATWKGHTDVDVVPVPVYVNQKYDVGDDDNIIEHTRSYKKCLPKNLAADADVKMTAIDFPLLKYRQAKTIYLNNIVSAYS